MVPPLSAIQRDAFAGQWLARPFAGATTFEEARGVIADVSRVTPLRSAFGGLAGPGVRRVEIAAFAAFRAVACLWPAGRFEVMQGAQAARGCIRVVRGVASLRGYEGMPLCPDTLADEDHYLPGSLIEVAVNGIQALGNESAHTETLITLHVEQPGIRWSPMPAAIEGEA